MNSPPKVSIITAVKNNDSTVEDCVKSVINQSYGNIEHIVIDGSSTDGTMEILGRFKGRISKIVSEKDSGPYHAFNKGIGLATGDIIGILNGDDTYYDKNVIADVVRAFAENGVDSVYGDLLYVNRRNPDKILRRWLGGKYKPENLRMGWMPPHPTFFVKRDIYAKYGLFNTDFRIASDYEMMLRLLYKHSISTFYIPKVLVKMKVGGLSNRTIKNMMRKSREDYNICRIYGFKYITLLMKNLNKIPQFFIRKDREK